MTTIYDYLITTNRRIDGRYYAKVKKANGFGLIDSWRVVEEKDRRIIRLSVTTPD